MRDLEKRGTADAGRGVGNVLLGKQRCIAGKGDNAVIVGYAVSLVDDLCDYPQLASKAVLQRVT
jgi:hypothetical protein